MTNPDFLRDLAERLMRVPVMYGVDQGDADRLVRISLWIEEIKRTIEAEMVRANARLDDNLGDD
jgi:hypothetical protein